MEVELCVWVVLKLLLVMLAGVLEEVEGIDNAVVELELEFEGPSHVVQRKTLELEGKFGAVVITARGVVVTGIDVTGITGVAESNVMDGAAWTISELLETESTGAMFYDKRGIREI